MRGSVLTGAGIGGMMPTSGFSDRVTLGDLGRIRRDPRVVLRVETLEGEAPDAEHAYWRGLAFDTFDGTSWSVAEARRELVPGTAEGGVRLGRGDDEAARLVQRIVREPVASSVLFAAGEARELHGTVRRLERDGYGSLFAAGQDDERLRYVVRTEGDGVSDRALRGQRALPPPRDGGRSLALPHLSDAFLAAARAIGGGDSDVARVRAIETTLRTRGRYTDDPPEPPPGSGNAPVEAFLLGEMAGHCEYFASAMVLVARAQGLPARLVNGFAGGRTNQIGDFVELSHSDAHAWVEVHFEQAGWVAFDPTPPDLRLRGEGPLSFAGRVAELGSALELWWFQRVVGFDRADQMGALRRAWVTWRGVERARERVAHQGLPAIDAPLAWREGVMLAGCAVALAALVRALRRGRGPAEGPPPDYAKALRLLARRGLSRGAATPARDFAAAVRTRVPAQASSAFDAITEAYLAERFGGRARVDARPWLDQLARGLRAAHR
jgi:transglutaminase-like putative cysteine protease